LDVANERFYRWVFRCAALYNLIWGLTVSLWPRLVFDLLGLPHPVPIAFFQCIGMMVGVYAIGYWMVSIDPIRYQGFVWIGLLGKLLGPIGLAMSAMRGELPWEFGWVCLFNDLIWWLPFTLFLIQVKEAHEPTRTGA
jgi:small multidrug resistance pump